MKIQRSLLAVSVAFVILIVLMLLINQNDEPEQRQTVKIAIPYSKYIRHIDSNYYTLWLEEKSGLDIEFEFIAQEQTEEYLRLLFSSGNSDLDGVFFYMGDEGAHLSDQAIAEYGENGYIMPLEPFINSGESNIKALYNDFADYDLRAAMTAPDGHIYAMPGLSEARLTGRYSMLWINTGWIKTLGLELPQTTDQLREVLTAFLENDPNGNGVKDEIPLAGCTGVYAKQAYNFILNAFVYNDPQNSRMFVQDGKIIFAPTTNEWRKGLSYLAGLYKDGLLPPLNFTYTENQLTQLANDPRGAVGSFAAKSVTEVLFSASTETLSQFAHLPPLLGPEGVRISTVSTPLPQPGGIVTSTCKNPKAVFDLMDLMLSEEASLIASYGEQGVDWDFASPGDINISGIPATINVKTRLSNKVQNKHLAGLGPMVIRGEYADGLTWSGLEADNEYIDSRAAILYGQFEPQTYIRMLLFSGAEAEELRQIRTKIEAYTDTMLEQFITGEQDPDNDSDWQSYVAHYEALELERYRIAISSAHNGTPYWRE